MSQQKDLDALAVNTIRGLSMDAVQAANSGHPGTPMALAPLGWTIFNRLRKHDPSNTDWADRDRFVLSCGHASMLQYALLHLGGYDLSLDDIRNFRQWDSLTPGHPEVHHTPGVEITTGPLGQGVATAVGMAMAEEHLAARFNKPGHELVDHRTWVIASDGDLMEGVSAEAASVAGHLKLGKLIVFWDDNSITIDGRTDITFTEDVVARYQSYGWHTLSVEDGEDMDALEAAARAAMEDPRPSFIQVKTIIGFPAPNKKDTSGAHGAPLGAEEISATKTIMGWPQEAFYVPDEMADVTHALRSKGVMASQSWNQKFQAYRGAFAAEAAAFEQVMKGELPEGWDAGLPSFEPDAKGAATRNISGKVINALAANIGEMVGGSADLAGSNKTWMNGLPEFAPGGEGIPRNVHFGIREHAMGSILNGMALHGGLVPYGATFLIFADYMRPALRLAALGGLKTRYVYSHDSIGLGEDGPTHQPVEHLASLRSIPGFVSLRPMDANETVECWKVALEYEGPAALVLTRQNVPTVDRTTHGAASGAKRGGYVLLDAEGGSPDVILIGTGSEVQLAVEARETLAAEGIKARVVSMPSTDLFEMQSADYQDEVLPPGVTARVVIEAGIRQGWDRWVGNRGGFVTLDRFGASAPAETLYEKLGITAARAVTEAKRVLGR